MTATARVLIVLPAFAVLLVGTAGAVDEPVLLAGLLGTAVLLLASRQPEHLVTWIGALTAALAISGVVLLAADRIRRALGGKRGDITSQFLIEATVQTTIGGLLGVVLGLAIVFGIPPLWNSLIGTVGFINAPLPAKLHVPAIFLSLGVSIGVGLPLTVKGIEGPGCGAQRVGVMPIRAWNRTGAE